MITMLDRWVGAAVLLLAAMLVAAPAQAQTQGAAPQDPETIEQVLKWNAECLECHTEAALVNPPREVMDLDKLAKALRDPHLFDQSNHAGMACKTCHIGGYQDYPHQDAAKPAQTLPCVECHAKKTFRIDAQVADSVHSKNLSDKFTCTTCHDPHEYASAVTLKDPVRIVAQDNAMCVACHESDAMFAEFGGTLTPARERPDMEKIHDWLPAPERHWQAVRCIECHTPVSTVSTLEVSHQILGKDKAERNCVTCHTADTSLRTRLYRHMAENETAELGFLNSALTRSAYVVGATRNTYLDMIGIGLIILTALGVGVHGLIRILAARRGRRES